MDTIENSLKVLNAIKSHTENQNRMLAKEFVKQLTESQCNAAEIAHQLAFVQQEIAESIARMDTEYFRKMVCFSEIVSKGLRIYSQQQNTLKYYYYRQFQASIESFVKIRDAENENSRIRKALSRKHAKEILRVLYIHGECKQVDLVSFVNIDKGNLSREIERLIEAELVEKRKLSKFCYYSLTPQARRLCLKQSSMLLQKNKDTIFQNKDSAMMFFISPKHQQYQCYMKDYPESGSAKAGKYAVWDNVVEVKDFNCYQWR